MSVRDHGSARDTSAPAKTRYALVRRNVTNTADERVLLETDDPGAVLVAAMNAAEDAAYPDGSTVMIRDVLETPDSYCPACEILTTCSRHRSHPRPHPTTPPAPPSKDPMPPPPTHPLAKSNPELYAHLMTVVDDVVRVQTAAMMKSFEGHRDNELLDRRLLASIEAQGGRLEEPNVGALRAFLHDEARVGQAKVLFLNACIGIYTAGYAVVRRGSDGDEDEAEDAGQALSLEDLHVKSRKIP